MSHVTTYKTKTQFVTLEYLREALQGLGTLSTEYTDYYGNKRKCDLSIFTQAFPRGFGFLKEGNAYTIKGDTYNYETGAASLLRQIELRYKQVTVSKTLSKLNFMQQTKQELEGAVIVARRY